MTAQYQEPFVDRSTSCTIDFAVALMLGRRYFDGIYPTYTVEEDPINPMGYEVAHDRFLEFLDTSVFEILEGEQLDIEMKKQLAIEAKADVKADDQGDKEQRISSIQEVIDKCRQLLVENEKAVSLARKYLRDIDDELANKVNSALREDTTATQKHGGVIYITLASLDRWLDTAFPKNFRSTLKYGAASNVKAIADAKVAAEAEIEAEAARVAKVAAEAEIEADYDLKNDQCNEKGQMNKKGRESLYLTFGVLLHRYLELAKEASILSESNCAPTARPSSTYLPNIYQAQQCLNQDGSLINLAFAHELSRSAKPYGKLVAVRGQGYEAILGRLEEALKTRAEKIDKQPLTVASQIT